MSGGNKLVEYIDKILTSTNTIEDAFGQALTTVGYVSFV